MTLATDLEALRGKQAVVEKKANPVVDALAKSTNALRSVLPKHITPERMSRMALGILRTNASLARVAEANPASFAHAVVMAGQLGLEIGSFGEAHLVPFGNEITLIPGYQGLVKLVKNTGLVIDIYAHEVREKDDFELTYGLARDLKHKPMSKGGFPCSDEERGEIVGFYSVAVLKDGTRTFWAMSRSDVDATRDASRGYQASKKYKKESPWDTHYEAMGRKTVVRALCNWLPKSAEARAALEMDYALDAGRRIKTLDADFTVEAEEPEPEPEPKQIESQAVTGAAAETKKEAAAAEPPEEGGAPTLEDLTAMVKAGDIEDARAICPAELSGALEGVIKSWTAPKKEQPHRPARRDGFD